MIRTQGSSRGKLSAAAVAVCALLGPVGAGADPVGTSFTFQGTLLDGGLLPSGSYDFVVSLFDSPSAPAAIASPNFFEEVPVAEGLFQLTVDFGSQFVGQKRWLQVGVRDASSVGEYAPLLPRQELTPTPYAQFTLFSHWNGLFGIPAGFDDDVDDDQLNALPCALGEIPILTGSGWGCATYLGGGGGGWQLTGNAGTIPGTHFLGTTDAAPLEIRVGNLRAQRIELANPGSGFNFNFLGGIGAIEPNLTGVTIAGGGFDPLPNHAYSSWSTIGGGFANRVGTLDEPSASSAATIAGGYSNLAGGATSTIGGGSYNTASAQGATVAGGDDNEANGVHSTVGGGTSNEANAAFSTVGGGGGVGVPYSGNRVFDDYGTVAGGGSNEAGDQATGATVEPYATVGGGASNRAFGEGATVAGGVGNRVDAPLGVVGGGGYLQVLGPTAINRVWGTGGAVLGGSGNQAGYPAVGEELEQTYAAIGGGYYNVARAEYSVVGGGLGNQATGATSAIAGGGWNQATALWSTIAGGAYNQASADTATVGGGQSNGAAGEAATIAGGHFGSASGDESFVGGGNGNEASGWAAAIGGGWSNQATAGWTTIGGGRDNDATGELGTVAGGEGNLASGDRSAIPGGSDNIAGCLDCFAAGSYAHAIHEGSFVWSDNGATVHTPSPDVRTFTVQAEGGIWLGTTRSPSIPAGVFLATSTGGYLSTTGDWTNSSDRAKKRDFAPVDGEELLARLARLPISTWNYLGDTTGARHLGPMAQDFHALFGLGQNDVSISTVDSAGVALAAVQQLARRTAELETAQAALAAAAARVAGLEARLLALEARLAAGDAREDGRGGRR